MARYKKARISRSILIPLFITITLLSSCTSSAPDRRRGDFSGFHNLTEQERQRMMEGGRYGQGRQGGFLGNLSDEERARMMEERQLLARQACEGKSEGESCQLQGRTGEMQGKCTLSEENIICMFERQQQ